MGLADFAALFAVNLRQSRRRGQFRAALRDLPPAAVAELLRPLEGHWRVEVRALVQPLVLEFCPPTREVVPAAAPAATGREPISW